MTFALPASGLVQTFSLIVAGLCRAAASRIAIDRSAGPLLVRIFTRLHRLTARLTSLVARIQAGKLATPRPRRPAAGAARTHRRKPRLPQSRGWLLREVPGTAEHAGQVQALLDDPPTAVLLEAASQAGRILRPLCRMLAIRSQRTSAAPSLRRRLPSRTRSNRPPSRWPHGQPRRWPESPAGQLTERRVAVCAIEPAAAPWLRHRIDRILASRGSAAMPPRPRSMRAAVGPAGVVTKP